MDRKEKIWHARNWLHHQLGIYWRQEMQHQLMDRDLQLLVEQYFKIFMDDGAVLLMHCYFKDYPYDFQIFLLQFMTEYYDKLKGKWKCVNASACAVHWTRCYWWDAQW